MKHLIIITFLKLLSGTALNAQSPRSKDELKSVLKETLAKSRNAVSTATNKWRYDNSKDDYFQRDTIVLSTARTYRMDFCKVMNWSFYKDDKFVLENAQYCNEPPTKLISKREDSIKIKIKEYRNRTFLELQNINGVFEKYEIIDLKKNKPLSDEGDYQFDYTLILLRISN